MFLVLGLLSEACPNDGGSFLLVPAVALVVSAAASVLTIAALVVTVAIAMVLVVGIAVLEGKEVEGVGVLGMPVTLIGPCNNPHIRKIGARRFSECSIQAHQQSLVNLFMLNTHALVI